MQFEDIEVRPGRTLRLYYQRAVNGSSAQNSLEERTILFLHGVAGCAMLWKKQMEYFCEHGYDTYSPDLYGHGDSRPSREPKQRDFMFVELRQDILELFDWINPAGCIIVSHSYGASFASYLARERESQIKKLVNISNGHPRPLKTCCCSLYRLPVCCFNMCGDYLRRGFMALAFSESPPSDDATLAYHLTPALFKYTMRGQVWEEANREYHGAITQPTLLIIGSRDNFVSLSEVQETEEVIPEARLVIFHGVGHMVMLEVPEQLSATILDFIRPIIDSEPRHRCGQAHTKIYSKLL